MLTKVLALVLVVLIGLALGIETARYVHAYATGVDASGVVNIHQALGFGLLATSGALLLSLSREWFSRQWTRFTVWLELTLDGLFDFDALLPGETLHRPVRHRKTTVPRMMKLPPRSPPPNREGKQPDDSYIIEVGQNETHEDVVRRHPDVLFIQGDVLFKQAGTGPLTVRRKGEDSARTK